MSRSRIQVVRGSALSALILVAGPVLAEEPKGDRPPATSAGEEPKKNPQVRTYTSVTVLSDPSQAPPLPSRSTGAASSPTGDRDRPRPPSIDRPQRDERGDVPRDRNRAESVRELRQEIQEMRRDLRKDDRGLEKERDRPAPIVPRPDGVRPDKPAREDRVPERRIEREKARENQTDRRNERVRNRND